jgi:hypothetical protein
MGLAERYDACKTNVEFDDLEAQRALAWPSMDNKTRAAVKDASVAAKNRLADARA